VTDQPHLIRTHVWDGGTVPAWVRLDQHHFDNGELVIRTPDGDAQPRPGWSLVGWTDGTVTVASPTTAARVYGPDGIAGRLERAEAALARIAALAEEYPAGIDTALIHEALDEQPRTTANNPATSKDTL
jgi:hypothetical protein